MLIGATPFIIAHLVCFAAIWTGVHMTDILIAVGLYALRMFGVTAGYHRYFSHKSYKTGRVFQFILAFIAQSSAQRGVLWWAAGHRHHHKYSDTPEDLHSPAQRGFWYSHVLWIFAPENQDTDMSAVPDLAKYPELVWLDRNRYLPAILLGFAVWLAAGWSGLVVGFFWSTVALWHATFTINSLSHVFGRQRYLTGDTSRNNVFLALLTFGEGWHNNHHHYQSAACQGFRWYEVDISYYALRLLAALGIVRDLKRPPRAVVMNESRAGRTVVERAASQLAASFSAARIAGDLRQSVADGRLRLQRSAEEVSHRISAWQTDANQRIDSLQGDLSALLHRWQHDAEDGLESARDELHELMEHVHLPTMPSMADLRSRAQDMFATTPSMNDVVARARQILLQNVAQELRSAPA